MADRGRIAVGVSPIVYCGMADNDFDIAERVYETLLNSVVGSCSMACSVEDGCADSELLTGSSDG